MILDLLAVNLERSGIIMIYVAFKIYNELHNIIYMNKYFDLLGLKIFLLS